MKLLTSETQLRKADSEDILEDISNGRMIKIKPAAIVHIGLRTLPDNTSDNDADRRRSNSTRCFGPFGPRFVKDGERRASEHM